jgi:glycosyltransferase involved in cell wall biosynthesis
MRLLRSIGTVNPVHGGPIEGIKQVARMHRLAGHETEIVSMDAPEDAWVKEFPVKVHAMGPGLFSYDYTGKFVPWLAEHRRDYDAVIVSGLWRYSGFGTWRALRGTDTPYFVFPHGMLDSWFKRTYPLKHLKKWLLWPWADYRMLRDARAVLFTSEEERRAARESFWLYCCNEVVVNYGIAAPPGDAAVQKDAVLQRFPELAGKRAFVFLSRIHEKKGCDLLIRAFAKIARAEDSIRLVFAGPEQAGLAGRLRSMSAQLGVADRIVWTGMLSGDLKWGMLQLAEVFVLPSHQENFGIAVAEALACGTPVLISNKVNIWREIEQDHAGLVDEDDEPGTTRLLQKWLGLSAGERELMRANARQSFQKRFEVKRAAESLIETIQGAVR